MVRKWLVSFIYFILYSFFSIFKLLSPHYSIENRNIKREVTIIGNDKKYGEKGATST
jgi:hypothetical protein